MTDILDWVIDWVKINKGTIELVSAILGIVGAVVTCCGWLVKSGKGKNGNVNNEKCMRKNARRELITTLEKVFDLDAKDSGKRFMGAFYDLKENGIAIKCDAKCDEKMRYFIGLKSFVAELEKGHSIQGLNTEEEVRKVCRCLEYLVKPVGRGGTKPRVYINTAGENISSGYEQPHKENMLSDLECERVERIGEQVRKWGMCNIHLHSCTLLIIGGMRDYFCRAIVRRVCIELGIPIIVLVHTKTVSQKVIGQLHNLVKIVGNLAVREVDESTTREGYDLLIYSHYWQHERDDAFKTPEFHLRKGGLLIWMSAISRGAGISDTEYVCEGYAPRNPQQVKEDAIGYINDVIEYTKMDGRSNEKAKIHYDALGSGWGGCSLFFGYGFPRSFQVSESELANDGTQPFNVDKFCRATKNFLDWYFSPGEMDFRVLSVEAKSIEFIKDEQQAMLNASKYALISVSYLHSAKKGTQELIVEMGTPDCEKRCTVTLYPCTDMPISILQLDEANLCNALSSQYINDPCPECKDPRKVIPENVNTHSTNVCKVIARIKSPLLKHYLFYLQKKDGRLYVACLPFRMYLTADEYKSKYSFNEAFDARIDALKDQFGGSLIDDKGFVPFRMDSVTILRSYSNIKEILRGIHGVDINDECTFFYKSYGAINQALLYNGRLKKMLKRMSEKDQSALNNDTASLEKDRAFNKFGGIEDRLQVLGCLNVHDVLMFGVKKS